MEHPKYKKPGPGELKKTMDDIKEAAKIPRVPVYHIPDVNPCLLWEPAKHLMSKRKASSDAS
jgi:hypothetical protein